MGSQRVVKGCDSSLDGNPINQADRIAFTRKAGDEGLKAFEADGIQPLQFGQRFGVVVNAQIETGINLTRMNAKCGGLFAALVAARRRPCLHCRNKSFSQRSPCRLNERLSRGIEHLRAGQHVPGNAEIVEHAMTAPVNTLAASMRSGAPVSSYYMQLALLAAYIGINELTDNLVGWMATGQKLKPRGSIKGVHQCLCGQSADRRPGVDAERTHGKKAAGDRNPEVSIGISGD